MARMLTSAFTVSNWTEQDIAGAAGALRRTVVHYGVSCFGEISGTGAIDDIMVYRLDGTVAFVGYAFFEGALGTESGTVVFEHHGAFTDEGAESELAVVPGTATGDLANAEISGRMLLPHDGEGMLAMHIAPVS